MTNGGNESDRVRAGCLHGLRVIEVGGIGAVPFCAMMLADHGAEVLRIQRHSAEEPGGEYDGGSILRGRRTLALDLKKPEDLTIALQEVDRADVLLEGFRPGVAERLGLGPDPCHRRNPRLVYGRLTGWGQQGPRALEVGHDINFIALAGVLGLMGRSTTPPTAPLNLAGDAAGGGMLLAFGVLGALLERATSGLGQVVDAAMVDGAALLATPFIDYAQSGRWGPRGTNIVDGGAPFYDCYRTADELWLAVGAVEPAFYRELLDVLGLANEPLPDQYDKSGWPLLHDRFAHAIGAKTRDEWCALAVGTRACITAVLEVNELAADPHLAARQTFVRANGTLQPAPAPRFSRTPAPLPSQAGPLEPA